MNSFNLFREWNLLIALVSCFFLECHSCGFLLSDNCKNVKRKQEVLGGWELVQIETFNSSGEKLSSVSVPYEGQCGSYMSITSNSVETYNLRTCDFGQCYTTSSHPYQIKVGRMIIDAIGNPEMRLQLCGKNLKTYLEAVQPSRGQIRIIRTYIPYEGTYPKDGDRCN